jgi:hypothetical protein
MRRTAPRRARHDSSRQPTGMATDDERGRVATLTPVGWWATAECMHGLQPQRSHHRLG